MDYLISVGSHYLAIMPLTGDIMHRKHVFEMYIWLCEFPAWHMSLSYIILMRELIYIIILTIAAILWIIRINLIYKTVTFKTIKICSAINYRKRINIYMMWISIWIMEIKESREGSVDTWAIRLDVNNYCTSIEFSHPENRKHSCSRKWVRIQSVCRCRFDSPIFVKLKRDGRHRRDRRPRNVAQLISTVPMCKCTDEKKRAASFARALLLSRTEIKRVISIEEKSLVMK